MKPATERPEIESELPKDLTVLPSDLVKPPADFWTKVRRNLRSACFSTGVHTVLIVLLAIPVIQTLQQDDVTTILGGLGREGDSGLGEAVGKGLDLQTILPPSVEFTSLASFHQLIEDPPDLDVNPQDITELSIEKQVQAAQETGNGNQGNHGSGRVLEPATAVRAGNFSVWTWPILGKDSKGRLQHGKPGDPPIVRYNYHIVIRLKVPASYQSVKLDDFYGDVIGSDKYRQRIPIGASYFDQTGNLVPVTSSRGIPVVDGTAELLIFVPYSLKVDIEDTVTVTSRITNETQKLVLRFTNAGEEQAKPRGLVQ